MWDRRSPLWIYIARPLQNTQGGFENMRNLRKLTAVIIVIALVLTSMTAAFAATTTPVNADKAATLKDLGLYAGTDDNDVSAGLDGALTTQDSLVFLAKLFGYKAAADELTADEVTKALAKFADAKDIASYARNVVAYSAINGILSGSTKDGKFYVGAKDTVTAARFATFMLKQMGYVVPSFTEAVAQIAEVDGSAVSASEAGDLTRDIAVGIMYGALTAEKASGATVIADIVGTDEALKAIALKAGLLVSGELAVTGIKANTAKSFLVKFTRPVTDEDKITFEVKRLTTSVTVTPSWNADKTEVALVGASNFAESTFAVGVLADGKEIAKENISITTQKIAKIDIVSKAVAVTVGSNIGYVNYKVYDQYDNDITTSAMANSLNYQPGINSNSTIKNGVMKIEPATTGTVVQLLSLQALTVVLYDSNTGVTATKSLPISTAVGTLSSFEFGSVDNVKLVEGDTTSVFYIPYTAKDLSGNETKDYELVSTGLIDANSTSTTDKETNLVVSLSSNVTATVVKDPANSKNAAIEVKYVEPNPSSKLNLVMDMPVTITAMTYGGNSATVQTTLAKAKAVETLLLLAPAETVSAGQSPEIPFEAYDKNGEKLSSYTYVNSGKITPNGFKIVEKADGNAKFVMDSKGKGPATLSANVKSSGKVSNILTINVQDAAYPASLQFVQSGIVSAMEVGGATQDIEFGDDLIVYDQYDRKISDDDMNGYFTNGYSIDVKVTGNASGVSAPNATVVTAGTNIVLTKAEDITLTSAGSAGSSTISFDLKAPIVAPATTGVTKDTASTAISLVPTGDIESYTIGTSDKAIYAYRDSVASGSYVPSPATALTAVEKEYGFQAKAYGLTAAGTKVILKGRPIAVASVSNGKDFIATATTSGAGIAYDGVYVVANKLDNNRTAATTDLTLTITHNNVVKPLKVAITSSTTDPVAKDIKFEGADSDGLYDKAGTAGKTFMIQKFVGANGTYEGTSLNAGAKTNSKFYFYIEDSYGTKGMKFVDFRIAKVVDYRGVIKTSYTSRVTSDGALTISDTALAVDGSGNITAGDTIYVTAITNNGLSATMQIQIKN